jgi:SAM-dependent methyltransferase
MIDAVQTTRATYARIAEQFAGIQAQPSPQIEADLDFLATGLPGGLVADVGCGPGRDTAKLRSRGLRVVGLDLSDAMLRAGGLPGVAQADMRVLPLRTGSLNGIWCQAALLHIPHRYAHQVLSEFARTVRPGGLLHISVGDGDGERYEVAENYGSDGRRWFAYYREDGLRERLSAAGFEVFDVARWEHYRPWLRVRARRTPM